MCIVAIECKPWLQRLFTLEFVLCCHRIYALFVTSAWVILDFVFCSNRIHALVATQSWATLEYVFVEVEFMLWLQRPVGLHLNPFVLIHNLASTQN